MEERAFKSHLIFFLKLSGYLWFSFYKNPIPSRCIIPFRCRIIQTMLEVSRIILEDLTLSIFDGQLRSALSYRPLLLSFFYN